MFNWYSNSDNENVVRPGKFVSNLAVTGVSFYVPGVGVYYFGLDLFYPDGVSGALDDRVKNLRREHEQLGMWDLFDTGKL